MELMMLLKKGIVFLYESGADINELIHSVDWAQILEQMPNEEKRAFLKEHIKEIFSTFSSELQGSIKWLINLVSSNLNIIKLFIWR